MSLKIDVNTVARLLLRDGSWYEVLPGSLTMDVFEWTNGGGIGDFNGRHCGAASNGGAI